jgi:hypothetical protein
MAASSRGRAVHPDSVLQQHAATDRPTSSDPRSVAAGRSMSGSARHQRGDYLRVVFGTGLADACDATQSVTASPNV